METCKEVFIDNKLNIKNSIYINKAVSLENRIVTDAGFDHRLRVISGTMLLTLMLFLVLPLMQTISRPLNIDLMLQPVDTAYVPPPPPPPEPEPEEKPETEEKPPELMEDSQPLDLAQLELALNSSFSDTWISGDFTVDLKTIISAGEGLDSLFSMADLDQKPRVIYQPGPILNAQVRRKAPGTVYILFIVDQNGRVENPMVQSSMDPIFEKPALNAVKQWKFEPGKRKGQPVRFRMRVPISFPKG